MNFESESEIELEKTPESFSATPASLPPEWVEIQSALDEVVTSEFKNEMGRLVFPEPWLAKVVTLASNIAIREGCILYDIESLGSGRGRILRVYVDKPNGADIEDCARVSNALNLILDVEEVVPGGAYILEVSSPGLDRSVRFPWQYKLAIGKLLNFKTKKALGELGLAEKSMVAAKSFEAIVLEVRDNHVVKLQIQPAKGDGFEFELAIDEITKAKWVFKLTKGKKR